MKIEEILKYLSNIFTVFTPRTAIVNEKAEKRDIKNKVRAKKAEVKIIKLDKKLNRLTRTKK